MQPALLSRPDGTAERCRRRYRALGQIRAFFGQRDFVEVDTPVAIAAPAPEPYIDPIELSLPAGMGQPSRRCFLQASPELAMKRLLAAGLPRLFQLAPTFRAGDYSLLHRNEFRMLEWYRDEATADDLQADCEALLSTLFATATGFFTTQGRRLDFRPPFARLSLEAAFVQFAGFSLADCVRLPAGVGAANEAPEGDIPALQAQMRLAGIAFDARDSWDDLFHRVFLQRIEPQLSEATQPVFLTDFPAPLASLAKLRQDDPRLAERFELYVAGIELANAFSELCCPDTQRQRFTADAARRRAAGRTDFPLDEAFLAELGQLQRAAGIALGIDRLLLLLWDERDLGCTTCLPDPFAQNEAAP
jgi:lysyl-tRNA synthetase class 2